ncbi:MAG: prolipoprotein diacylglyceryl transferase [Duodenibacillus sp.]|nr:prolipoprotein diacylglyceryl transferase [Duodenibacillus sp.]
MLVHPQFDPVAFSLGPVAVHWYGLMYLAGFAAFWLLGRRRARDPWRAMTPADVEDLLFFGILGVILGGRLGFCLFYQPAFYLAHPLEVLRVWQGGMSAHGGMLGAFAAIVLFARLRGKSILAIGDFAAPLAPLGLGFGRLGNFINGELWGRFCSPELPWGMIFPQSGALEPRHPSQLYEAGLEGFLLFALLWLYTRAPRPAGRASALFCLGYAAARFTVEFFREPDSYLGLGLFGLSRGQWLTAPLMLLGLALWALSGRRARA